MSFNQLENALLADAIRNINNQIRKIKEYRSFFEAKEPYLGSGIDYITLPDGRLTVINPETRTIDERVEPAPCYNLIRDGEDIASAVRRIFL